MLKTTINIKELVPKYRQLNITGFYIDRINDTSIMVKAQCFNHGMRDGDFIIFNRYDGEEILYNERYKVTVLNKDYFVFAFNFKYRLYIDSISNRKIRMFADKKNKQDFLQINLSKEHLFCENRSGVTISNTYDSNYSFGLPSLKRCKDKRYFLFNDTVLYYSDIKDLNGKMILMQNQVKNAKDRTIYFENGEKLEKCFAPFKGTEVKDDKFTVFCESTKDFSEFSLKTLNPYCYDERFFEIYSEKDIYGYLDLVLKPNTKVLVAEDCIKTHFTISEDTRLDLTRDEEVSERYINGLVDGLINPQVDYECKLFIPVYTTNKNFETVQKDFDNELFDIRKIKFNIHLREREGENFDKNENLYWNCFGLKSNTDYRLVAKNQCKGLDNGDPLGLIGFTPDDMYSMTERLKKTFIRLTFYDSPDRNKQSLLFYSTVFLDANLLHTNYLNHIRTNNSNTDMAYVLSQSHSIDNYNMNCEFNIYDMFNSSGCSEGFYLYLFPDLVDGNYITTIYMKVEFNHAIYGKIIPLVMPSYEVSNGGISRIDYTSKSFPITYLKKDNGNLLMNMSQLYKDMYIKVCIKYDFKRNRYVWFFPSNDVWAGKNGTINISLFEPKTDVNNIDIDNVK